MEGNGASNRGEKHKVKEQKRLKHRGWKMKWKEERKEKPGEGWYTEGMETLNIKKN